MNFPSINGLICPTSRANGHPFPALNSPRTVPADMASITKTQRANVVVRIERITRMERMADVFRDMQKFSIH